MIPHLVPEIEGGYPERDGEEGGEEEEEGGEGLVLENSRSWIGGEEEGEDEGELKGESGEEELAQYGCHIRLS